MRHSFRCEVASVDAHPARVSSPTTSPLQLPALPAGAATPGRAPSSRLALGNGGNNGTRLALGNGDGNVGASTDAPRDVAANGRGDNSKSRFSVGNGNYVANTKALAYGGEPPESLHAVETA